MITKIAAEAIEGSDVANAGAGAIIAKKSLDHGLHRVFGLRGETHTTNRPVIPG